MCYLPSHLPAKNHASSQKLLFYFQVNILLHPKGDFRSKTMSKVYWVMITQHSNIWDGCDNANAKDAKSKKFLLLWHKFPLYILLENKFPNENSSLVFSSLKFSPQLTSERIKIFSLLQNA